MRDNREQWPSELRLRENGRILSVSFENGDTYDLSAEYLRVMSPSAEVQGHRREERLIIGGKRHCSATEVQSGRAWTLERIPIRSNPIRQGRPYLKNPKQQPIEIRKLEPF